MHVEKRKVGNALQYYLAHSYRKFGKVRKVRIYLGKDLTKSEIAKGVLDAKAEMNERLSQRKEVRDPYLTALTASELKELQGLESSGKIKLSHLSDDDWLEFTETFAYNTNAIEGSTVGRKEAANIIEKGRWPEKPKEEISEIIGVANAVKYIRKTKQHISIPLIRELHRQVFMNSRPFAGKTRKAGEEVAVVDVLGNILHRGAPSRRVIPLLRQLVEWYGANKNKYSPLILAAVVHNRFENIHPFRDGNGRVGRLLLVNILIKHGLPPVNIELKNRREYYDALQQYELRGNIRPTLELLLKEYRKGFKSGKRV